MNVGIYNFSLQKRLESLYAAPISDVNKKLISNFVDYCFTERLSQHRVLKYIFSLKAIAFKIQFDFDEIEKKDLFIFISDLKRSNSIQWLKHDYKVNLKKFYKLYCKEDNPELTKWIKTTVKKKDQKLPEDMLSESEVLDLIEQAENQRDKAIIALLWDIGARIGEIGNLTSDMSLLTNMGLLQTLEEKMSCQKWSGEFFDQFS